MVTEKDILEDAKRERFLADAYLKGIVDFVKWSSTLAIAAILWIGNFLSSATGIRLILSGISLFSLLISLVVAILAVKRVLTAWSLEWDLAQANYTFSIFKKYKWWKQQSLTQNHDRSNNASQQMLDKLEKEQIDKLLNSVDSTKPFSESKSFNIWINIHITLLIVGLLTYIVAQFWNF